MTRLRDLTNQPPFGRLTVLSRDTEKSGHGRSWWICQCVCGTVKSIRQQGLISRRTLSCGCLMKDINRERMKTHGQWGSEEYHIFYNMKQRCLNPHHDSWKDYGGRGITICERWMDFQNFWEDMGPRPGPGYSLERIDNSRGYSPDNVIWATQAQQTRNMRRNHWITYRGITRCLQDWANIMGMPAPILIYRLDHVSHDNLEQAAQYPHAHAYHDALVNLHQFVIAHFRSVAMS